MAEEAKALTVSLTDEEAGGEGEGQQPEEQDTGSQEKGAKEEPPPTTTTTTTTTIAAPDVVTPAADNKKSSQPLDPDPVPIESVVDASTSLSQEFRQKEVEAGDTGSDDADDDADDEIVKERLEMFATGKDFYCWHCHKERGNLSCSACPRSYHRKCLPANYLFEGQTGSKKSASVSAELASKWICPECKLIEEGEERRRTSLSAVSDEELNQLLISALGTIKTNAESLFYFPVSDADFPEYKQFILHPMDFQAIDRNVRKGVYKSTDGFTADVKWILHNCYIYNSPNHVLTKNANYFFKVAKTEMGELEVCPDCFKNYYQFNKTYFIETCKSPHRLVWARLKGHPFWPAKLVRIDAAKREGDCRFFGAHDRAWVSFDSIFLLSEQYPWTKSKSHKSKLDAALSEARAHIEKLSLQFPGVFRYADPKTSFNFANACLTSDDLMSEPAAVAKVTEGPVAQKASVKEKEKQKAEMITQNKDEEEGDGMLLDDEERPLIIDAPGDDASPAPASSSRRSAKSSSSYSPSTSAPSTGIKRKMSDSGKNKAISSSGIAVKKSSAFAPASDAGNGSGAGSKASAAASNKAVLGQKSKIPTKKAISTASSSRTAAPGASASSSSSSGSSTLTNCPPVTAARTAGVGKRRDSPSAPIAHKKAAAAAADTTAGRKARIVPTGSKSAVGAASTGSAAKKAKLADSRNETSLLSSTKGGGKHAVGTSSGVSGANNKSSSRIAGSKSAAAAVTHAANGSLLASAPSSITSSSSITIHISSDADIGSADDAAPQQSPSSSPDTSLPSSSGKNCSSDTKGSTPSASNSHPAVEVKQLKDEIKRLKDQVSKLMIEMKDMKELTESQTASKVSQEKDKALSDLESRLTKSFATQLEDTKRKQWCAQCLKEAIYFCCWNTSYCGYECQSKHWPSHMPACQQNSKTQSAQSVTASSAATSAPSASSSPSTVAAPSAKQQPLGLLKSIKTDDK